MAQAKANWPSSQLALFITLITIMIHKISATNTAPIFLDAYCRNSSDYNYAANDTLFPNNLNTLLHSLATNAANNTEGFYSTSAGTNTDDAVYGLFLCRGDQNTSGCSECVATAVREQPERINCPRTKRGVIWYDKCMIRYDEGAIAFGQHTSAIDIITLTNNTPGISDDHEEQVAFKNLLQNTMEDLAAQAAKSPGKKYANLKVQFKYKSSSRNLYTMVQCLPDPSDNLPCTVCLMVGLHRLQANQSWKVLQSTCNLRYEMYPFLDTPFNSSIGKKKVPTTVIIAIVVPVFTIAVMLFAIGSCLLQKKVKKYNVFADEIGEDISTIQALQYDLGTLQFATNNFSYENKLGEGGFGSVYKGTLTNGQDIAVKKLSRRSSQGIQEFKNEVVLVAKLQHKNLVCLLGFCLAEEEKLLVYEHVSNKSLDYFLFDPNKQGQLNWGTRYKIIEGIARGMLYLHHDSRLRIIHRDLKAGNILLDENMNPKIADFGMARIFGVDQIQGNTNRVVGTYGYMSPEYAMHGQFSIKSDVYSYGVLLLEIISGKRSSTYYESSNDEDLDLFSYAWKQWKNNTPMDFMDPTMRDSCSVDQVMRCLQIGLLCVQEYVDARPTMSTIVLALDSPSVTLPVPAEPILFSKRWPELKGVGSDQSCSVNNISVTEVYPR